MEKQKKQLVINDQLVSYYQFGTGERTMIFIHGWRSSAEAWFDIVSRISAPESTIYCLDMPGFGGSPAPKSAYSVSDYAAIVAEFISKINVKNTILAGHSFGGRVAIKLSATQPNLVEALVLVDSAGIKRENKNRKTVAKIVKPLFSPKFMQGLRRRIYKQIGSEDYLATPELKDTYLNIIGEDLSPHLGQIRARTLLVWGRDDAETPVADANQMHEMIKNSELEVIENAGHFSFVDQPEKFADLLVRFLTK